MLQITFRHMTSTESLRELAEEKIARIAGHYQGPVRCHLVIDEKPGHARKGAEFTVHAHLKLGAESLRVDAHASHRVAQTAVREVFANLERQLASEVRSQKGSECIDDVIAQAAE